MIVANAWGAGADNPTSKHQIARELVRAGHRVLWVEGAGMRRPRIGSGADRGRMLRKVAAACRGAWAVSSRNPHPAAPSLWVLSPLFVPLPECGPVRRFNGWLCRALAGCWCRRLGFGSPALINYVPVLAFAMRGWPGRVVYHCVDRWDAFDMYDSRIMARADRQCCEWADLVIASAVDLAERCRRYNPHTELIRHGVDYAHFAGEVMGPASARAEASVQQSLVIGRRAERSTSDAEQQTSKLLGEKPADLPGGAVIGFIGLLSEWVDQALLVRLADQHPGACVVLIGAADVSISPALPARANVQMLGPRAFSDIPRYVAHFTVGVIPFVVNDLTRSVNPIKLREMLAAGCPVVSTALPEVAAIANELGDDSAVVVAEHAGAFVEAVGRFLERPLPLSARRRLSAGMARESWERKVAKILACIEECGAERKARKG